ASSIRRSATAGRSSAPTAGCATATPGRGAATTSSTPSASAAPTRGGGNPERVINGAPYDTPVPGHGITNTNFLRLWSAMAAEEFDLDAFQVGEYWRAVDAKIRSENVTKVLYPNDHSPAGKQLRLEQQYFFVSCALQDCIRLLQIGGATVEEFADVIAVQLNDTH